MSEPVRLFEAKDHAEAYAKYRVGFPDAVVDRIVSYVQDGGCQLTMAVDVACGTGHQSTLPLSRIFQNTIGVDISQEQINQAPRDMDGVTFRVGRAENLNFIQDGSVDLVSVATAIHWLDLPAFYKEVDRILKPHGCLAVYWKKQQNINQLFEDAFSEFRYSTSEFRPEGIKKLFDRKELPECPYGNWEHDQSIVMTRHVTVDGYINTQSTLSYYRLYMDNYPQSTVLEDYKNRLVEIYSDDSDDKTVSPAMELRYTINLLLCRKP